MCATQKAVAVAYAHFQNETGTAYQNYEVVVFWSVRF